MINADIARAVILLVIPLLAAFHVLSVWWIYGVSFAISALDVLFDAAQFAVIPSLVSRNDLVTANGRVQASYSAARVSGPFLAGVLIAIMPLSSVLLIDAFSFLISACSLALIKRSFNTEEGREPTSLRQDIGEGLCYVSHHAIVRTLAMIATLFNFVAITAVTQIVLFAKQHLHASDTQVGVLYSAGSVGFIVFSLLAGMVRRYIPFSKVILGATIFYGLLLILLTLVYQYWLATLLWGLCSGCVILFNISTTSLFQTIVPNHMLGRVTSTTRVLAYLVTPLGTLIGGILIEQTHQVVAVYGGIGVLMVLIGCSFFFTPLGHAERDLLQDASQVGQSAASK